MQVKTLFFRLEEWVAFLIGHVVRPSHVLAKYVFVFCARRHWALSRKTRVWLTPFFMELGGVALDQKGPSFVMRYFEGFRMELDITEKTQRNIFFLKVYEEWITHFIDQTIKEGDVFIDVGANVGYYTLLATSKGARVMSYEPERENFARLLHNLALNNFSAQCLRMAVGNKSGTMTLQINPLNRGGNSMLPNDDYKTGARHYSRKEIEHMFGVENLAQEVEVNTLDSLVQERVKILKIDVEGFEAQVFEGMEEILSKGMAENIICELGNKETREEVIRVVKQHGYRAYSIDSAGSLLEETTGRDLIFVLCKPSAANTVQDR